MPIVSVRIPANVFDPTAKQQLAEGITDACAAAESIPDEPARRIGTWVLIDEVAEGSWFAGGSTNALAAFVPVAVCVNAPEGVLDDARRDSMIRGVTAAVDAALESDERTAQTSITLLDVPEGRWGVRDRILGLKDHAALWGYAHLQHLVSGEAR